MQAAALSIGYRPRFWAACVVLLMSPLPCALPAWSKTAGHLTRCRDSGPNIFLLLPLLWSGIAGVGLTLRAACDWFFDELNAAAPGPC